jgi:SAM-dependent methyltransferase
MTDHRPIPAPSLWVTRFASLIPKNGPVLDLACGSGRHTRLLVEMGYKTVALDRNTEALLATGELAGVETIAADLENGNSWPLGSREFAGIIVTNYLHRPLFPFIIDAVADRGLLIYETFSDGNAAFGKPSNPKFLLQPNELLETVTGKMRVVAFEEGKTEAPRPAVMQRICAVKNPSGPMELVPN